MSEIRDQLQKTLGGSYTLERELGGGGMSRVFVAEETSLGRKVVVKVLPPELAAAVNLERFRREIQLAAKLQHPLIVPVLAAGVSEGLPYYTMPLIEGESLRARLSRAGELPIHDAVRVMRDMLSALSYAHDHGVVHRDIKPDNVLLTGQHAVVADFGVAKAISASTNPGSSLTSLGVALGTPAYMSPEQAAADPSTDHRSDLYSVGAVAYEMLSGQQVFSSRSPAAMLAAHATETPEPIEKRRKSVPPLLAAVIMRSLEKHAADRPQSAGEMLAQVDAAVTPSGASTTPYTGTMPARKVASSSRSTWMAVGAAAVLLALGSSSAYWYKHKQPADGGAGAVDTTSTAGSVGSVAVIPFVNTGGNPSDEYFSDGMTDELAHALSRIPRLRVAGRTSSYAFKGKTIPPQQMGKELNVAAIVEGSIRRSGDRLRVIAQLTSATDGRVLWSDSYESKTKDVFQLQDEFTKAIVGALAPALIGGAPTMVASASRGTDNQEAYDLYLKGRFFFLKRGSAGLRKAIDYFSSAAKKDPKFARARAGLAMAYGVLPGYAIVPADSIGNLAIENAKIAMALDSTLGDAYLGLANALSAATQVDSAEIEFQRALRLQPGDAATHQWHGDNLEIMGRVEEALAEERRASELDPLSPIIAWEVGYALFLNRRFDEAVTYYHRALELNPTFTLAEKFFGMEEALVGRPDSAIRILRSAYARDPGFPGLDGALAFAYAAAGRWADADRMRASVEAQGGANYGLDGYVYELFGDRAGALNAFDTMLKNGVSGVPVGCDPLFDRFKTEPRFLAIFERWKLRLCPATLKWPVTAPPTQYIRRK
ncbi:MAG: protein kinase [Gemmatimonadaceae bacterium]|nr:protein kinase [Gemmatimonadaceae bacterium]